MLTPFSQQRKLPLTRIERGVGGPGAQLSKRTSTWEDKYNRTSTWVSRPIYANMTPFPATIVIYNIKQCLHCISDQFDVILMDKNKDISHLPHTF